MAIDPKDLENQERLNSLQERELELLQKVKQARESYTQSVMTGAANQKELADQLAEYQKELDGVSKQLDEFKVSTEQATNAQSSLHATLVGIGTLMPKLTAEFDKFYGTQLDSLTSFSKAIPAVSKFASVIHDTQVELRRVTGFQDRYSRSFTRLRGAYAAINLPQAELEKNLIGLNQNFSAFDAMSPAMRDNLTMLAGNFTLLGVSGEDTGKMLDDLQFSFGIVGDAAVQAGGDLRELSKETGLGMSVLLKDLNELSPELARFGMEGTRVFAGMAKQARSLGLSTKDIFDVSEQLDTFQGAAEIVGRMNAQFGMQLNSVELMKASHEERVDILRQEFQLQGRSFQALDRRQKQMLASILGRDVKTVAKLFGDQMDIAAFQEDVGKADPIDKFTKFADRASVLNQQIYDEMIKQLGGVQAVNDMQIGLLKTMQQNVGVVANALKALMIAGAVRGVTNVVPGMGGPAANAATRTATQTAARTAAQAAATQTAARGLPAFSSQAAKKAGESMSRNVIEGAAKGAASGTAKNLLKRLPFGIGAAVGVGMNKASGQSWGRSVTVGVLGAVGGALAATGLAASTAGVGALAGLGAYAAGSAATEALVGSAYDKIFGKPTAAPAGPAEAKSNMENVMADMEKVKVANATSKDTIQLNIQELVVKSSVEVDGDVLGQKTRSYFNTALNPTMAN
jgi:hypothetical protein